MQPYELTDEDVVFVSGFMALESEEKKKFWNKFESDEKKLIHKAIKQYYIKEQKYKCAYCQNEILINHGMVWDVEHIISRDEEPDFTYVPENLCVCCKDCNIKKSNKKVTSNEFNKKFPKDESFYIIPHPHFSQYRKHIFKSDFIYSPLTPKGTNLINICDLTRFAENKIHGDNGVIGSENDALTRAAIDSFDDFINKKQDYSLLTLKGVVDALVEKKFH